MSIGDYVMEWRTDVYPTSLNDYTLPMRHGLGIPWAYYKGSYPCHTQDRRLTLGTSVVFHG